MKIIARLCFLALIVLGVAIQLTRGQRGGPGADPIVTLTSGLERLTIQTRIPPAAGIVTAEAASCARPLRFMLLRIDGSDAERLRELPRDGHVVRYIYRGMVLDRPDRVALIGQWVWASVQFVVGWRGEKPRVNLVLAVLPDDCPALPALDWALLSPAD